MTTIEKASTTDTRLRGYYVGKIDGVTVCCCKGRAATKWNLEYLEKNMTREVWAALTRKHAETTETHA